MPFWDCSSLPYTFKNSALTNKCIGFIQFSKVSTFECNATFKIIPHYIMECVDNLCTPCVSVLSIGKKVNL